MRKMQEEQMKRMRHRKIEISEEQRTEIVVELKRTHPAHVYRRLIALKMRIMDGISSKETGVHVGLNESSVNAIIKRYFEQGIEALITKRHDHGNRYMSKEQETEFLQGFVRLAEAGQIIEVTEIHRAYQEAVGHPVTRNAIYYMLHKHGWRKVMPRGKHPKRASEAEVSEYQKNLIQDPDRNPKPQEFTCDVSGRGWIWAYQQA